MKIGDTVYWDNEWADRPWDGQVVSFDDETVYVDRGKGLFLPRSTVRKTAKKEVAQ